MAPQRTLSILARSLHFPLLLRPVCLEQIAGRRKERGSEKPREGGGRETPFVLRNWRTWPQKVWRFYTVTVQTSDGVLPLPPPSARPSFADSARVFKMEFGVTCTIRWYANLASAFPPAPTRPMTTNCEIFNAEEEDVVLHLMKTNRLVSPLPSSRCSICGGGGAGGTAAQLYFARNGCWLSHSLSAHSLPFVSSAAIQSFKS